MRASLLAITSLLSITGSAIAAPPTTAKPSPLLAQAKAIIADRMVDPDSLTVRNVTTKAASFEGRPVTLLCGEYNAKNRMGGYVGSSRFVYEPAVMQGVLSADGSFNIEFFSSKGGEDASHDPRAAIKAGINGDLLEARFKRALGFAKVYLPVCMGLKS